MITDILQWFRIRPDPNHLAAPAPTETLQFVISINMSSQKKIKVSLYLVRDAFTAILGILLIRDSAVFGTAWSRG